MELFLLIIFFVALFTGYCWLINNLRSKYYLDVHGDVVHIMRFTENEKTIKAFTSSVTFADISKYSFGTLSVEQATIKALKLFQREAEIWRDTGRKRTK